MVDVVVQFWTDPIQRRLVLVGGFPKRGRFTDISQLRLSGGNIEIDLDDDEIVVTVPTGSDVQSVHDSLAIRAPFSVSHALG